MSYTFRSPNPDGTVDEVELTREQALDLVAGGAIMYTPRDQGLLIDENGAIIWRSSAIPQRLDEAA